MVKCFFSHQSFHWISFLLIMGLLVYLGRRRMLCVFELNDNFLNERCGNIRPQVCSTNRFIFKIRLDSIHQLISSFLKIRHLIELVASLLQVV